MTAVGVYLAKGRVRPVAHTLLVALMVLVWSLAAAPGAAAEPDIDPSPLREPVRLPDWFKLSFLDLGQDLADARRASKRGLLVYFGQEFCPYCKVLLERDFARPDIEAYTRRHFDVVAVDTRGARLVTDLDGAVMAENDYAERHDAALTPTLIFYDPEGRQALRLTGYHSPYELRAALEYVADGHFRRQGFGAYLDRGDGAPHPQGELNREPFLVSAPYALDRSHFKAERPLLVLFEQPACHACDVLHAGALRAQENRALLRRFEVVQLNVRRPTPVITPKGQRTSARDWARGLGVYYTPTLIFYAVDGRELLRVDSVAQFQRLGDVLRAVLEREVAPFAGPAVWRHQQAQRAAASP